MCDRNLRSILAMNNQRFHALVLCAVFLFPDAGAEHSPWRRNRLSFLGQVSDLQASTVTQAASSMDRARKVETTSLLFPFGRRHSSSGQEIPDTHPPATRGPISASAVDLVEHQQSRGCFLVDVSLRSKRGAGEC